MSTLTIQFDPDDPADVAKASAILQKFQPVIVPPLPVPDLPDPQWEVLLTDKDWLTVPLNTEMPGDNVEAAPEWAGWLSGTGENGTQSFDYASTRIQQRGNLRKLVCKVWNTMRVEGGKTVMHPVGARAFYDRTWKWWGNNFQNRTARIRVVAVYPTPFTLPNGAETFAQIVWEFKTLDQPTAIQVLLRQGADGKLYHYLSLAGVPFGLDKDVEPLQFGVPIEYMLIVDFKRTADAKVTLIVNHRLIAQGTGRTLNEKNGYGNAALLAYSNELQNETLTVEYSGYEVARQVNHGFVAEAVRDDELSDEDVQAWVAENQGYW